MLDMTVVDRTFRRQLTRFTGFPARQLERHLQTLVRQYKRTVAICEQFQDPVTRRFERKIDQVISPGTIIGQEFHDTHENNFLLAITTGQQLDNQVLGLAWIDISTGDFFTKETTIEDLETDLAHIRPSEILIDARLRHINEHIISRIVAKERHIAITYRPLIDTASASKILHELNTSGSRTQTTSMSSRTGRFVVPIHIEDFTAAERLATAFIVDYINQLYPGRDTNLNLPERYDASITMRIDRTVIQSLELVRTLDENTRKGSLLHTIDRTTTKAGARLLYLRMGK
jgi:DNA mismatch repair ATPase MutS